MAWHQLVPIACWRQRHGPNESWVLGVRPACWVRNRPVWRGPDRPNLFQATTDWAQDCRFHCCSRCYSGLLGLSTRRRSSRAQVRWPTRPTSRDYHRNHRDACRSNRLNWTDSRRHLPPRPPIVSQLFRSSQESVVHPLFQIGTATYNQATTKEKKVYIVRKKLEKRNNNTQKKIRYDFLVRCLDAFNDGWVRKGRQRVKKSKNINENDDENLLFYVSEMLTCN